MATYSVIVAGTGIKVPSAPDPIIGFVTTRRVRAVNEDMAAKAAKELLLQEWQTSEYKTTNIGSEPMLEIEEVRKLNLFEKIFSRAPTKGYSFYTRE